MTNIFLCIYKNRGWNDYLEFTVNQQNKQTANLCPTNGSIAQLETHGTGWLWRLLDLIKTNVPHALQRFHWSALDRVLSAAKVSLSIHGCVWLNMQYSVRKQTCRVTPSFCPRFQISRPWPHTSQTADHHTTVLWILWVFKLSPRTTVQSTLFEIARILFPPIQFELWDRLYMQHTCLRAFIWLLQFGKSQQHGDGLVVFYTLRDCGVAWCGAVWVGILTTWQQVMIKRKW